MTSPTPAFLPVPSLPLLRPLRPLRPLCPLRRVRSHVTACTPSTTPLSRALSQIHSYRNASEPTPDSRAFAIRLINDVATSPLTSEQPPTSPNFSSLFQALRSASLLTAFSAYRPKAGDPPSLRKAVSPDRLAAQAGLPISALSPKRSTLIAWQAAGVVAVVAVVQLSRLLALEHLAKPAVLAAGAFLLTDQLALRGATFEAVYRTLFPAYAEKVLKHEAGHFLAAYLHGLAVRGYVLSAGEALRAGIPGQAGTLFEDEGLYEELRSGILSGRAIDRFSIVSMAGIAAEAIHYGEAEGGESDVASLIRMLTSLNPPWKVRAVKDQARWAVLEAVLLLRQNVKAFDALCEAMRERKSLGECILVIEENFVPLKLEGVEKGDESEKEVDLGTVGDDKASQEEFNKRERAIVAELERIKQQVESMEKE